MAAKLGKRPAYLSTMNDWWIQLMIPAIYYGLHSLLVAPPIQEAVQRNLAMNKRSFRAFYVVASTIGLSAAWAAASTKPYEMVFEPNPLTTGLAGIVGILGALGLLQSFKPYDTAAFLGLKAEESVPLHTAGWQGRMRHPLYFFTILLFAALFLFLPDTRSLAWLVATVAYAFVGSWLEERKLIQHYGEAYKQYQKSVPRIFPRWPKS
jgi:protein-S-isoprenylcysteine O-methyltransferase Ste14